MTSRHRCVSILIALAAVIGLAGCPTKTVRDDDPVPPPPPAGDDDDDVAGDDDDGPTAGGRPPVATDFELASSDLVLPAPVVFETGSDRLRPESEAPLWHVVDYLAARDYITTLRIEGHVGYGLDPDEAQALTEARALAVSRWLVAQGVDCGRLLPVGFGDNKPIASSVTAEENAQNTRITFVNAALRGRLIGGMPADGSGRVAGDPCQ
jgi:OOP family OmpA-OmpF porin